MLKMRIWTENTVVCKTVFFLSYEITLAVVHLLCRLSVFHDLTVPGVLVLCVCLYVLALVLCKKADVAFEKNQRVHYLPDNSTSDPYLYAATIHTGLCSAAYMSAKVKSSVCCTIDTLHTQRFPVMNHFKTEIQNMYRYKNQLGPGLICLGNMLIRFT